MDKFTKISSVVTPLPMDDVDTDLIIPAQFLTSTSKDGYGQNLFRRLRDSEPDSIFNKPETKNSKILLSANNFACGSSREHAVWAIMGYGFRVVIAKSFADIFTSNSAKNGLLLITLPGDVIDSLLRESSNKSLSATVDLEEQVVSVGSATYNFSYDQFRKHCLIHGLDDIDYILDKKMEIDKFRNDQARFFSTRDL
jgi:3-isopropylmalate/(R)-2-methylmalate dehydratase small subunit